MSDKKKTRNQKRGLLLVGRNTTMVLRPIEKDNKTTADLPYAIEIWNTLLHTVLRLKVATPKRVDGGGGGGEAIPRN